MLCGHGEQGHFMRGRTIPSRGGPFHAGKNHSMPVRTIPSRPGPFPEAPRGAGGGPGARARGACAVSPQPPAAASAGACAAMSGYGVEERAGPHSPEYRLFFSECSGRRRRSSPAPLPAPPHPAWARLSPLGWALPGCTPQRLTLGPLPLPCRGCRRALHLAVPRYPHLRGRREGKRRSWNTQGVGGS